jgi:aldehyde:ferredoxin oxidoreductase
VLQCGHSAESVSSGTGRHVFRRLHGKIPRVDLSKRTFTEGTRPEEIARDFIGVARFTVKYLYDEVPPDCDRLGHRR